MPTNLAPQQQPDPYAEFGGSIASAPAPAPSTSDPYAEFGGSVTPPPQPEQGDYLSKTEDAIHNASVAAGDVAAGFGKGALSTAAGIRHITDAVGNKIGDVIGLPKLGANADQASGVSAMDQLATPTNTAQTVGFGLESIAEFMLGDEALKGLSLAAKLKQVGPAMKLLEETPILRNQVIQKMLAAGFRQGAVGGAQEFVHSGGDIVKAAESGAAAGVTGGVLEGAANAVKTIAPTVKNIAGESIPVRASQDSGLANAAEIAAPSKPLQKFDVAQTQPAARRAIGKVASGVESADISGQTLATGAKDLSERADQIREQSKPIFEKLDELTKDQDMKFSDWQKKEQLARQRADFDGIKEARAEQESLLDQHKDEFAPNDYKNARANWRQAAALEDVHDALNTKGVVGPTPLKFRPKGSDDVGYINGQAFSKQILDLKKAGTLKEAGLTPEHIQNLQDLGTLLENSANVHKFGQLAHLLEVGGSGLTAVMHPAAAVAGAKAAIPAYLAQRALGSIMTNPKTAAAVVNILRSSVVPAVASQGVQAAQQTSGQN